jgi:hypothetical protein
MLALIDADIVAWKAACATERTQYRVNDEEFRYKKEAVEYCTENELDPDESITPYLVEEPFGFTESNVDALLKSIMNNTGADECRLFLTGKDNYREKVSTTRVYKGNRKTKPGPKRLPATKQYLAEVHGAEVVDGAEADDMLGVCQGEDTIICSIDKDLRTIPGKHYNLDSGVVDEVTRHDAWHTFWSQVLTGDSTDNIEGLKGCGKVGTAQCVGEVDYEIPVDTYAQMLQRKVTALYCEVMGEKEGRERLREMATLLWIQQEMGNIEGWDSGEG